MLFTEIYAKASALFIYADSHASKIELDSVKSYLDTRQVLVVKKDVLPLIKVSLDKLKKKGATYRLSLLDEITVKANEAFDLAEKIHLLSLCVEIIVADGELTMYEGDLPFVPSNQHEKELLIKFSEKLFVNKPSLYSILDIQQYERIKILDGGKRKDEKQRKKKKQEQEKKYYQKNTTYRATKGTHLYSILELAKDASIEDIKTAYRRLASIHHPDKVEHLGQDHVDRAKLRFQTIKDAYEKLKMRKGF